MTKRRAKKSFAGSVEQKRRRIRKRKRRLKKRPTRIRKLRRRTKDYYFRLASKSPDSAAMPATPAAPATQPRFLTDHRVRLRLVAFPPKSPCVPRSSDTGCQRLF